MSYYRICGFQSHTWRWFQFDDNSLCETVFDTLSEKNGMELVLGVLPSGASYVLATSEQFERISRSFRRGHPVRADLALDYTSLSPITFRTREEFEKKVKSLQQKSRKKGKRSLGAEQIDNSQANKAFFLGKSTNLSRSNFEHQRVLWKAIQGQIDFCKFSMPEMFWLSSASLISIYMNTWNFGPIQERKKNPKILDLGWTLIDCMSLRKEYTEELYPSSHIIVQEHQALSNSGTKRVPFKYGDTETCRMQEVGKKLKEYFDKILSDRVFLVVHDKERTVNALANLGLDTSNWITGVSNIVRVEQATPKSEKLEVFQSSKSWTAAREIPESKKNSRARSRSPTRWGNSWVSPSPTLAPRRHSPPRKLVEPDSDIEEGEEVKEDDDNTPAGPIIYIIDVQDLFFALSRDPNSRGTPLHTIARKLGIYANPSTVCAGNDCHLLVRAWINMASGNAVDEQRAERWSCSPDDSFAICMAHDTGGPETPAEPEVDINDIDPSTVRSSIHPVRHPGCYVPEGDDDSDDDDWFD